MPTTIELAGPGTVPALPAELHPIAYTAQALPARTWGVVTCPDDGEPILETPGGVTQVVAGRLAIVLTGSYGPAGRPRPAGRAGAPRRRRPGVYVVYRCPTAVTVHTPHIEHRGNTIGTLPVQLTAAPLPIDVARLVEHIHLIGDPDPLHQHAVANERREHQHRPPRPRHPRNQAAENFQPTK